MLRGFPRRISRRHRGPCLHRLQGKGSGDNDQRPDAAAGGRRPPERLVAAVLLPQPHVAGRPVRQEPQRRQRQVRPQHHHGLLPRAPPGRGLRAGGELAGAPHFPHERDGGHHGGAGDGRRAAVAGAGGRGHRCDDVDEVGREGEVAGGDPAPCGCERELQPRHRGGQPVPPAAELRP